MNMTNIKVVLTEDDYRLCFQVAYRKGKQAEPWHVNTKIVRAPGSPLCQHKRKQVA